MTPDKLKTIRLSLGWTLDQIALATDYSRSQCHRYEAENGPDMPELFKKNLKKAITKKIIELQKIKQLIA